MVHADQLQQLFSLHVAAAQLIAGGEGPREFSIQSTSSMSVAALDALVDQVRATGISALILLYDFDGGTPRLQNTWLLMPTTRPALLARGEDLTLLADCKLWAPGGDGPFRIVAPMSYGGHFVVDGTRLEHRSGLPASTLAAGMRRAERRIAALARAGTAVAPKGTTACMTTA